MHSIHSMLARPRADQDPTIFTPNEESRANPPEVEKIVASDELGIKSTERTGYVKVRGSVIVQGAVGPMSISILLPKDS